MKTWTMLVAIAIITFLSIEIGFAGGKRSRVIDFEDEVVEGLNKRPLDSLSQISEKDRKRKKSHLYRKRIGFSSETIQTIQLLRHAQ